MGAGAFGGWTASFGFLATTLVVMLFAGLQASRPRMLEDTLH